MSRAIPIRAWVAAADRCSAADREALAVAVAADRLGSTTADIVTCHRVEHYAVDDNGRAGAAHAAHAAGTAYGPGGALGDLDPPPGGANVVRLSGEDAVRHLIRLAVGLESAILGEDQVLHQVRLALAGLCSRGADPRLSRLFEVAVGAGRRARSEYPSVERNLGELAARWLERRVGLLRTRSVVIAGAGPMGRLAAGAFARRGAAVTVASRSMEHARAAAEFVGARAVDLEEGAALANTASGVVVALAGPWREFAPSSGVAVVDLSFPLAVSPLAREQLDDALADVDRIFREAGSLQTDGRGGVGFRSGAEAIVDETVAAYGAWSAGRSSVSTLRALREQSDARRRDELERLLRRLPNLDDRERALVAAFSEQLLAGLLHQPSAALRDDEDGSAAAAAALLFGL